MTDEHMPGMTGNDLLAHICETSPATVRVMLTGAGTLETAVEAINSGAVFRYLQKPCTRVDLLACLAAATVTRRTLLRVVEAEAEAATHKARVDQFDRALDGMWMAVQPIVQPSRRGTFAHEALVRTTEPSVPHAGAFIEIAERSGRMRELDWAIRLRLVEIARNLPEGESLFVNVPPCALKEPWFGTDEDPLVSVAHRIVLEITEGTSSAEVIQARPRIEAARRAGFRIAIDDLGAGEAGLGIVATLQPDIAKVDRELVREVDKDPIRRKLVRGLAAICRELDVTMLAEGVETVAEYEVFRDVGCDLFQGYLFARPGRPFPSVTWPF